MYNLDKKELIMKDKINTDSVSIVKYSTDYKYLATAGLDGLIHIFDTTEYKHIRVIDDIDSAINVILSYLVVHMASKRSSIFCWYRRCSSTCLSCTEY
jgi:WD40 repeat protein